MTTNTKFARTFALWCGSWGGFAALRISFSDAARGSAARRIRNIRKDLNLKPQKAL